MNTDMNTPEFLPTEHTESKPSGKEYVIRNVSDLLKVPRDRRTDCLMEIDVGLLRTEQVFEAYRMKLPKWLRFLARPRLSQFTWIDDGKVSETVRTGTGAVVWQWKDGAPRP
jgi:hypothetical protein